MPLSSIIETYNAALDGEERSGTLTINGNEYVFETDSRVMVYITPVDRSETKGFTPVRMGPYTFHDAVHEKIAELEESAENEHVEDN